ncbi:hypothetical protein PG993_011479 [Apiospora rasikravindrae]|uniref:Uncharacterized protein n=1 Tax=Apiospora rasikravindrae TaxID=990691 RepID=A0ABR1SED6_9PEZI
MSLDDCTFVTEEGEELRECATFGWAGSPDGSELEDNILDFEKYQKYFKPPDLARSAAKEPLDAAALAGVTAYLLPVALGTISGTLGRVLPVRVEPAVHPGPRAAARRLLFWSAYLARAAYGEGRHLTAIAATVDTIDAITVFIFLRAGCRAAPSSASGPSTSGARARCSARLPERKNAQELEYIQEPACYSIA